MRNIENYFTKKKIIAWAIVLLGAMLTTIYFCDAKISKSAKGKIFNDTTSVPYNKVGLLLGTSKYLKSGEINLYYSYRIDAANALLKANKIKYLIISGDNGTKAYNEPVMMRNDLIKAGIDSSKIILDYAGFRTFDSMVRLKEIFGQTAVTIISQQFHNERAIYTANRLGLSAVGFNAKDVIGNGGLKTQLREKLARVKVFLDFIFGNNPKFLGTKIELPA